MVRRKLGLIFPSEYCLMTSFMKRRIKLLSRLLLAVVCLAAGGCTYSQYGDYRYPYDSRYNGHPVIDPPILSWKSQSRV